MRFKSTTYAMVLATILLIANGCGDNEDGGKPPKIDPQPSINQPTAPGSGAGTGTSGGGTAGGGSAGSGSGGGTSGGGSSGGGTSGGSGTPSLCPFADSIILNSVTTFSSAAFYEGKTFTNGVSDVTLSIVSYSYSSSLSFRIDDYVEISVSKRGNGVPVWGRVRNLSRLSRTGLMSATPTNPICFTTTFDSGDFNNDFGISTHPDNVAGFLLDTIAGPDWKTTSSGSPIQISFFTDGTNAAIKTSDFNVIHRNGTDTDTVSIEGRARIFFQLIGGSP